MLTEMDDYFIHQTIDTFDHVFTSDARFQDRNYFNVHPRENLNTLLIMGLGNFPNTNVMDGYVLLSHNGHQYNLRPSRALNSQRHRLEAGPFKMTILEPWKRWQLTLADGPHGFSFDITYTARTDPYEHRTPIYHRAHGAEIWHQIHVQQSSNYNGWIQVGDTRIPVDGWWGSRDRSWGVRGPIPGAPDWMGATPTRKSVWMSAQFEDCAVHTWSIAMPDGEPVHIGGSVAYTDGRFSAPFVAWSERLIGGGEGTAPQAAVSTLTDSEGKRVEVTARKSTQVYLVGATNSNDNKGFGTYRGESHVEHDLWTPDDLATRFPAPPRSADNLCSFDWEGRRGAGVYEGGVL